MPITETMTIDEIDATIAELRARRKTLKSTGKVAQRKIHTLAHRRERLLQQVSTIDEQIAQLHGGNLQPVMQPIQKQRRARRRHNHTAATMEAILTCVGRHTSTKRATIITECQLSPANASIYLRQLCQEGKLIRHGEKSAAMYQLP